MTKPKRPIRIKVSPILDEELYELVGSSMPYKHALPGVSSNDEDSPYFWWIEYLRRNDQYQKCCRNADKGDLQEFFEDWGDINRPDFDTWFPYEHLFAERVFVQKIATRTSWEDVDLSANVVLICPASIDDTLLSTETIRSAFDRYLLDHFPSRKGNPVSTARYRIAGNPDPKVLKEYLAVYDERKRFPEKSYWMIGKDLIDQKQLTIAQHLAKDIENNIPNQTQLSIQIFKIYKQADAYVKNAVGRAFPSRNMVIR